MIARVNCRYFISQKFALSVGIVLSAIILVNCESIELDYAYDDDGNNNSTSYGDEYDEESTVERLSQGPSPEELTRLQHPHTPAKGDHVVRPKMIPLYDKDGERIASEEVYADVHEGNVKEMYYDSEGRRVTIPVLLRDQDFREANLTSLLNWIEWLDGMRATLLAMKEKTTSCKSHSYEELRGYASVTQMLKDIQDALKTVDQCENKLHEQLRDSGKQWNYPVEKKPGVG